MMNRLVRKVGYRLYRMARELYYARFPDRSLLAQLEARPPHFTIETINICNANCIFCAYQYQERAKQVMDDRTFEKALRDYVACGGGNLGLSVVVGDPLLDPNFIRRVQFARSFPQIQRIGTTTNCLHLHKVGAQELLTSGVSSICISTTGFDAEMYKRVYRSTRYEQMKRNVLDLLRVNNHLGKPVEITVALRVDRPLSEVLAYPDFQEVRGLADAIDSNAYYDNWSGRIKPEALSGNMKLRSNRLTFLKKSIPCSQLYAGIGVLVDGTVTACACRDLNGNSDLVLGNINTSSLQEMWHSFHLRQLREKWKKEKTVPAICADCTHYNPYTYMMLAEVRMQK